MITFAKYVRAENAELTNVGTLATLAGVTEVTFIPANLRSDKRVVVVAKNKKGESATISCSKAVSETVRTALKSHTRTEVLGAISKLPLLENEQGVVFISNEGGELEFTTITEVKAATINYEELVAF